MWWLFACRPARGGGSHNVRAEHQLAVRGPNGISDLLNVCVPRPPTPLESRAGAGRRRAGLGHDFDLVFMSRTQDVCGYRPARGGGSHHVCSQYQLRLRGSHGTYPNIQFFTCFYLYIHIYYIYTCCWWLTTSNMPTNKFEENLHFYTIYHHVNIRCFLVTTQPSFHH